MIRNLAPILLLGTVLLQTPGFAQEGEWIDHRSEASVQALGSFLKSTNQNGVDQSETNSGGVLASYRFFFDKHSGVEVNYGYARNSVSYGLTGGLLGVPTDNHQVSADYIFRLPRKRFSPFFLAGAGALVFDPRQGAATGATVQTRPAFVYGGGIDLNLTSRIFLRAEYRGFVFNSPTYDTAALSGLDRTTHLAEPSIGFGYRF
jgi:outer membrane immunogenic protein